MTGGLVNPAHHGLYMLSVGDVAPDFQLTAQDKSIFDSRDHLDSRLLVAFYPAAFTGVCTEEMCTLTDMMSDLENTGAVWWEFQLTHRFPMRLCPAELNRLHPSL